MITYVLVAGLTGLREPQAGGCRAALGPEGLLWPARPGGGRTVQPPADTWGLASRVPEWGPRLSLLGPPPNMHLEKG